MRLALGLSSEDVNGRLAYMQQIGAQAVLTGPPYDPEKGVYEYPALMSLKSQIEEYGMKYEGVSLLPWRMCYKWMLGLPGRDEQIEKLQTTIRNMGAAGVPVLIYNMHACIWHCIPTIHLCRRLRAWRGLCEILRPFAGRLRLCRAITMGCR